MKATVDLPDELIRAVRIRAVHEHKKLKDPIAELLGRGIVATRKLSAMNPRRFFAELKRRDVYKVAVGYGVVAWLLIQVATQVGPFFEIFNWSCCSSSRAFLWPWFWPGPSRSLRRESSAR